MPNDLDLWPEDIGDTKIVPPVAILREQATLLGRKTNQLVRARVTTHGEGDWLTHTFILSAPAIDYGLQLFEIQHTIELYPLSFTWEGVAKQIETPDKFVDHLKVVLGSSSTKRKVHSLLAQVKSELPVHEITDEDIPF